MGRDSSPEPPVETFADAPTVWAAVREAFTLVPTAAVEYLRGLAVSAGLMTHRAVDRVRLDSFTLAVTTCERVVESVRDAVADAVESGRSAKLPIQDILDAAGVSPKNPGYASLVARTSAMDAYNAGRWDAVAEDPEMRLAYPAWEYHAIVRKSSRPTHAARDGNLYPAHIHFADVRGTTPDQICNCSCSFTWVGRAELDRLLAKGRTLRYD